MENGNLSTCNRVLARYNSALSFMAFGSGTLSFVLLIVTTMSVKISGQETTKAPMTLQPSRYGNIQPTKEFCSGLHPPGYKRSGTNRPFPYRVGANWYWPDRIGATVLNVKGVYYSGVILQIRFKNVVVDGTWTVKPYENDKEPLHPTVVDCPPGVQNTLYLTREPNPMWYIFFEFRPHNKSFKTKKMSLRSTVVRKGNIYWRTRMKVDPYKFLKLARLKMPTTTTIPPRKFVHISSRTTQVFDFGAHTWRNEKGKVQTDLAHVRENLRKQFDEKDTEEMLMTIGWIDMPTPSEWYPPMNYQYS